MHMNSMLHSNMHVSGASNNFPECGKYPKFTSGQKMSILVAEDDQVM